jgi:hypothetical protein
MQAIANDPTIFGLKVTLTLDELRTAAYAGVDRRISAKQRNRPETLNFVRDELKFGKDIIGAIAEQAVAKATQQYWGGAVTEGFTKLQGDVGQLQVRASATRNDLYIRAKDKNDARFIQCRVDEQTVYILGYLLGSHGRELGHDMGDGSYKIEAADLMPIGLLGVPFYLCDTVEIYNKQVNKPD